jgi:hypothetical protein
MHHVLQARRHRNDKPTKTPSDWLYVKTRAARFPSCCFSLLYACAMSRDAGADSLGLHDTFQTCK